MSTVPFRWLAGWIIVASLAAPANAQQLERRWVYLQLNLQVKENVAKAEAIARRAHKAGYNGIVLADFKLNVLDRVPDFYFDHARQFKRTCDELGLEIIPAVCSVGYSDGILAHDPNLVEGLPVHDAEFVVQEGRAVLVGAGENLARGGDFEEARNHRAAGWSSQDAPGKASFMDTEVKHGGKQSLRFEDLGTNAPPAANGRAIQQVQVRPYELLHASVWIKSEDLTTPGGVRLMAIGADGRVLSHTSLGVKRTQDWTQHHVMFNTLDNQQINFYVGCWSGGKGKFWVDDVRLEREAFVNLVRRKACPLVVKDARGRELVEGRDFARLVDARMGNVPYAGSFDVYHQPPELKLLPAAGLTEGDKLFVSYYHTVTIYDGQVVCCLADPGVMDVIKRQLQSVEKLFAPKTYFLSHDEIRLANWCPACHRAGRSAGELLAENMRHCAALVREVNPQAKLCVWSDMFDPHHNARDNFYLVNGDLAGSWEGLPKEMTIVNWNHEQAKKSLPFFGDRGHEQVLAGYYDSDPAAIADWLAAGKGTRGITGAMYTTWTNNFDHLEAFAEAAWGGNKKK